MTKPLKAVATGLETVDECSNPSLSANKDAFFDELRIQYQVPVKVWQQTMAAYPYKPCRLVHHKHNLKKRWYVLFYAWNVATEKLERKRIFDPINRKKTVRERIEIADQIIRATNADLRSGKVLGKDQLSKWKRKTKVVVDRLTILECIKYFVDEKRKVNRRDTYLNRFTSNLSVHIERYHESAGIDDIPVRLIDQDYFDGFIDYLHGVCKSPKTFNNYRSDMITVLKYINKVRPGIVKGTPWQASEKKQAPSKKHAAFSEDQLKLIITKAKELKLERLVFFIQFMYYTLARIPEILSLRIGDIDLDNSRIIIRGDAAKNWQTEYVTIGATFRTRIIESGILNADPSFYIFGLRGPAAKPMSYKLLYKLMQSVLLQTGLKKINPNFSLYSCKHSGAVALYQRTLDIMAVKEQCRHKSIKQTDDYLRDLGLLRAVNPVTQWVGAI